ncbi:MAG: protein kinase [Lachnospiraceae bacterium]|nr:protein kinase [Lachnospiraceae bacterium]
MVRCLNCMNTFQESYGVCPYCGFVPGSPPKEAYHLNPGTVLNGHYIVGTTVGFGGFGITYRAWDTALDKMVAIKEFYPNGIVNRIPGEKEVIIYSGNRADEFQNGKIRFLAEARNMARFNTHPNIVNVYEFFEENNTAYIAMEFLHGVSYKQYIAQHNGRVDCGTAVHVVLSVLDALKEIHKEKIIHRDISPDNIFMVPVPVADASGVNYKVKLIDFGAARFASGDEEKTLSIILKPGYAPPEQYRSRSKQGPWTDLYAVGAVLYRSVTGRMPEESVNRVVEDHLEPPNRINPEIPQQLSDTIMRAMALDQELRFRNVDQFQAALLNRGKVLSVEKELKRRKRVRIISVASIAAVLAGAGLTCGMLFVGRQQAMYNVSARISVLMPDVNGLKEEEVREAGSMNGGETKQITLEDSGVMLGQMLEEYSSHFQKVELTSEICDAGRDYDAYLEEALEGGNPPDVFESSRITPENSDIWEKLGSLDTCYEALQKENYYFMDSEEFQSYFEAAKKQIPVSFCAPVLYVNTYLVKEESIPASITSLEDLELEGEPSYCVSAKDARMYREAFGASAEDGAFAVEDGQMGYEPFLRRETAYYLGDTDDYEAVRASLGGIYKMVVLKELQKQGAVKGRFTHIWSIRGDSDAAEKKASDSLLFYLAGETAQDVFNLRNGNGLPLNKNMMKTYVEGNDEFQDVLDELECLTMEYGGNPNP